jgi:hypothetical protein
MNDFHVESMHTLAVLYKEVEQLLKPVTELITQRIGKEFHLDLRAVPITLVLP